MIATPNMALTVWNLLSDSYDSNQLADNWAKVDQHDHSGNRGLQIPSGGIQDGAITPSKLSANITAPPSPGSVTLSTLGADVTTDYGYALTTYKDIGNWGCAINNLSATTFGIASYGTSFSAPNGVHASGATPGTPIAPTGPDVFYWDPADRAAGSGRSLFFRMRVWVASNNQTPPGTVTVALNNTTYVAGSSATNTYTIGSAVTGASLAFAGLTASQRVLTTGADFASPSAGYYVPTITLANTFSTSQWLDVRITLQMRIV